MKSCDIRAMSSVVCSYIGNLGLAQGLQQYLDIAKRAKEEGVEAVFLIYGSGAEEKKLRDYVSEHELDNVYFGGRLPNRDMRTVLEASDINFVSLVNGNLKDSVPTKLYEALGVGCPVLLAAEGDSVRVLEATGHGAAVRPNDSEQLWQGFMRLYIDREKMQQNKAKTMEIMAEQYSLQNSARRMVDLMEEMVK